MKFFRRNSVLLSIIIPVAFGILILYYYKSGKRAATDIGLGVGTVAYAASKDKYPIHIMDLNLIDSFVKGYKLRGSRTLYLWMGNSQLHGVNQYQYGQKNSVEFLFDSLDGEGLDAMGVSYPNANLQEMLLTTIYLSKVFPIKKLVLPVFYDDMRETGVRAVVRTRALLDAVKNDSTYFQNIKNLTSIGRQAEEAVDEDYKAVNETAQDVSERWLNKSLEDRWELWASRPDLRANVLNDLYIFRNMALGIQPGTVRTMIRNNYDNNFSSFQNICRYCNEHGIQLLVYIPPIRNDVTLPYEKTGYGQFKNAIREACLSSGAGYLNIENIVDGRYWGMKKSTNSFNGKLEVDFMHFQEEGHRKVADTILKTLRREMPVHDL